MTPHELKIIAYELKQNNMNRIEKIKFYYDPIDNIYKIKIASLDKELQIDVLKGEIFDMDKINSQLEDFMKAYNKEVKNDEVCF